MDFYSCDVDNRHGNHPDESKTLCQVAVLGDLFASRPGDCYKVVPPPPVINGL